MLFSSSTRSTRPVDAGKDSEDIRFDGFCIKKPGRVRRRHHFLTIPGHLDPVRWDAAALPTRRRLMRRIARLGVLALACLAMGQTAAFAQAIAGVVRDASGAVMPGVTVEASSPALIEKTRSVVTDS